MKPTKKTVLTLAVLFSTLIPVFAKEAKSENGYQFVNSYEYRLVAADIKQISSPYQQDDYVVFTADASPRHVGIAFDFEGYKVVHSYQRKNYYDQDGNKKSSLYFYILELPRGIENINYRLIIDGIWTTDPTNFNADYNPYTGIEVSTLNVKNNHLKETSCEEDGVHFIYEGKSGQIVRLAGTFTSWDSSIYVLTETQPGFYEIYLPLPSGTYYYSYYIGTKSFPDVSNHDRAYSSDGRITSKLVVK
ncbi:MAG: glycogen-binding domain-containing protein [Treponema sp.]|nr:glycogen-binding domain-containing protein [Treponema sp.]